MGVSWFLLLCVGLMIVILLIVNVYMLVHWSHPDDKNEAYFPKALVVRASRECGVGTGGPCVERECRSAVLSLPACCVYVPCSYFADILFLLSIPMI